MIPLISRSAATTAASFARNYAPLAAVGLAASMAAVAVMAPSFADDADWQSRPVVAVTMALSLAGVFFLVLWARLRWTPLSRDYWIGAVLLGLLLRLLMATAAPVLEDDWRRYLWDGAVVAAGKNPYASPPATALEDDGFALPPTEGSAAPSSESDAIRRLRSIGANDAEYPERVSYPFLTTIYPPVAQALFVIAHQIEPFDLHALRLILGAADGATFLLLIAALSSFALPQRWALLYWLNPLVIFETFNASHFDVLLGPFLVGALILARNGRGALAGVALAGAVGVKLWPILLAPLFMGQFVGRAGRLFAFTAVLVLGVAILIAPMMFHPSGGSAGFLAYAADWTRNAFAFSVIESAAAEFAGDLDGLARMGAAAVLIALSVLVAAHVKNRIDILPASALAVTFALFFLSPTGYPWYAIWLFILWPFAPLGGFALLAATLPLYHLRFAQFAGGDELPLMVRAIEFGFPLTAIAVEMRMRRAWRPSAI